MILCSLIPDCMDSSWFPEERTGKEETFHHDQKGFQEFVHVFAIIVLWYPALRFC
jgi:hypothetical protein